MSAQRRIIAECLDGEDRHVTAAALLEQAQQVLPEIGRATVYKALVCFVESGQVAEVAVGDGPTYFDPNANIAHDHLVCLPCGGIWDLPIEPNTGDELTDSDFVVDFVEKRYFGKCGACQ